MGDKNCTDASAGVEESLTGPEPSTSESAKGGLRSDAKPTSHAEIMGWLAKGGYLKSAIVEEDTDEVGRTFHTCFLLLSWCTGYRILHVAWPIKEAKRPRQFRDLDRLIGLIRKDFGYRDTIALRMAGGTPGQKVTRFRAV